MIEVDYLVIGAGAMGMAFTDTILTESEATVAIVDRRGAPGGHWNDAYPFVRLHQPSSFYGVNSADLGQDRIDEHGLNAGLYELASGPEVCAYFDGVMRRRFLPSGRVRYFPLSNYDGDGRFTSVATGEQTEVQAATVVDATYQNVSVPSMRPPAYEVADGVHCVPVNALGRLSELERPDGYCIVGGGKTAMDAVLWLLTNGVSPEAITTWIMPRDSWLLDRATIQPGPEFAERSLGNFTVQMQSAAAATSMEDLFDRLEAGGALLRLDPEVRPTMYRCATVTRVEVEEMRRVDNVIRKGRVTRIEQDRIVLEGGTVPTTPGTLHVDCSADGLQRRPPVPIFDGDRITLQPVRTCQQVFSAAFIAHVALTRPDDDARNAVCGVVPHPNTDVDWARCFLASTLNSATWQGDPELQAWLRDARLDAFSGIRSTGGGGRSELVSLVREARNAGPAAVTRLHELLADYPPPT
ncbi:MAG: NAD(P)/FAD-dependent oxidoreductase [Actinomycetota bacterium]